MHCLSKLDHYIIPNNIVFKLGKIYRFIGNNDFYIKSLGNDVNKVIDKTAQNDAYYLAKILKLDISDARMKLLIYKNSSPRTKVEITLVHLKEVLIAIQSNFQSLGLQSNDLFNILNVVYKHYSKINFNTITSSNYSMFVSQSNKSTRVILDEMNKYYENYVRSNSYDKIILSLHYFIDLYNVKAFEKENDTLALLILYQLVLNSDLNAFKYVSFFEYLYNDYSEFSRELSNASVNWNIDYAQTTGFVNYFIDLVTKAYLDTNQIIKNYLFDKENKKSDNILTTILSFTDTFTKEDIRLIHPYVSESTINRTLCELKEQGKINSLGKGRSARWIKL